MDNGTIIYIILTILFFVIQILTKKKKGNGDEAENMEDLPTGEQTRREPVSFEELLKEIRQEQEQREEDFEKTGQQDVQEKAAETKSPYEKLEKVPEEDLRRSEIKYYEGTYQSDHPTKGQKLVKLDDQVDLDTDERILKDVEDVAEEFSGQSRYRKLLRNPESLKDAVVVSEILSKKHF